VTARDGAECRVCIAGCGPAGAMLGFLLARAGLNVVVLEKHGDFLRDFRGDTIHPSTLEVLHDLGLAERFLRLPHSRSESFRLRTTAGDTIGFSFAGLPTRYPFIAFVPQWDFLTFVTGEAKRYPGFRLLMNADVTGVLWEDGAVRSTLPARRVRRTGAACRADHRRRRPYLAHAGCSGPAARRNVAPDGRAVVPAAAAC
jgi:2-polyprenyl-6-methoxyphenol hydroxylase-like FAD-dependent oxidoreductase